MADEPRLEEQLLSQEATKRISDQLDEAEQIDVDVQTDLSKIFQGRVDGVSIKGQGLLTQQNIRVQEIRLQTDSVALNPLSAIFGQLELKEPVNAVARIILTEADINHALTTDFTRSLIQNLQLNVEGKFINFDPQDIQVFLPGNGKIGFKVTVLLKENQNTRLLSIVAIVRPRTNSQPIMLESFTCTEGDGVSIEFVLAFMQKVKEIADLAYFTWEDLTFRVTDLEVKTESFILMIEVNLKQIPTL